MPLVIAIPPAVFNTLDTFNVPGVFNVLGVFNVPGVFNVLGKAVQFLRYIERQPDHV